MLWPEMIKTPLFLWRRL